jgi:hypothetical protein
VARQPAVEIRGLKEFRAELKAVEAQWPKELRKANKTAAEVAAARARQNVSGLRPVQRKVAGSIRAAATQQQAKIRVGGSGFPALLAMGALLGSLRYRQFPGWVGNDWDVGVAGTGPYGVNDAIAESLPEFIETYDRMLVDLTARAFPD